jgi:hypothetical protein
LVQLWGCAREHQDAGLSTLRRSLGWLKANTLRSGVFQTDWDDFSQLFFHNTHNTYTLGLDPTYRSHTMPHVQVKDITWDAGRSVVIIADTFGGLMLTDLDHTSFLDEVAADLPGRSASMMMPLSFGCLRFFHLM